MEVADCDSGCGPAEIVDVVDFRRADFFVAVHQVDFVVAVRRVEGCEAADLVIPPVPWVVDPAVENLLVVVAVAGVVAVLISVVAVVFFSYQLSPGFAS